MLRPVRVVLPWRLCLLFVWRYGGVLGHHKIFSAFHCSYVMVCLHPLLCFAGCGFVCLFPCWVPSCLWGCPSSLVWRSCVGLLACSGYSFCRHSGDFGSPGRRLLVPVLCNSQPLWVLSSVFFFGLPLLQGRCASCLRCLVPTWAALFVQSLQPFVVGSPSAVNVVLHLLWRGRLFGRGLLYPPATPVGYAPMGSLMQHSVPLASCRTLSFCCFSPGFLPLAFVQAWV